MTDRLLSRLADCASVKVPAELDDRVRVLLAAPVRPFLRPAVAAALAAAAFLSLVGALASNLAQTGTAEAGLTLALVVGAVYLALTTAAALPLLVFGRRLSLLRSDEVRP